MSNLAIFMIAIGGAAFGGGAIWIMILFATRGQTARKIQIEKAEKDFGNEWGGHG